MTGIRQYDFQPFLNFIPASMKAPTKPFREVDVRLKGVEVWNLDILRMEEGFLFAGVFNECHDVAFSSSGLLLFIIETCVNIFICVGVFIRLNDDDEEERRRNNVSVRGERDMERFCAGEG